MKTWLTAYRSKPPAQRRAMAAKASQELRLQLARVERCIAMDASPGTWGQPPPGTGQRHPGERCQSRSDGGRRG
ncbi:hypothetical protein ACWDA7_50510 [Streptomyces sp. NPDC001156]